MKLNYSIDELRLFWVVAHQGSFTKAAHELSMPISTLSRRINNLEHKLGLRLLNRDAHRVLLTGTGQQYFLRCDALFNEFQDISSELQQDKHKASGRIRIAAPINVTQQWLGRVVNAFLLKYPNIKVDLTLSNKNIDIEDRTIDLAIRVGESDIQQWVARSLYKVNFMFCVNSQKKEWHTLMHPCELADYPLIVAKPIKSWALIESKTGERFEYTPSVSNTQFAVDDLKIASIAVEDGVGIGLLPSFIATPLINKGNLKQIIPHWSGIERTVYMLYKDRNNQPLRMRLLIDFILNNFSVYVH